jgi:hypothetical protein
LTGREGNSCADTGTAMATAATEINTRIICLIMINSIQ